MKPPSPLRTIRCDHPGARHRVAGRLYAMRRGWQAPFGAAHWGACRRGIMTAARDLFRAPKQVGNMRPAGSLSLQAIHPDRKTDAADERFFECLVFSRIDQGDG